MSDHVNKSLEQLKAEYERRTVAADANYTTVKQQTDTNYEDTSHSPYPGYRNALVESTQREFGTGVAAATYQALSATEKQNVMTRLMTLYDSGCMDVDGDGTLTHTDDVIITNFINQYNPDTIEYWKDDIRSGATTASEYFGNRVHDYIQQGLLTATQVDQAFWTIVDHIDLYNVTTSDDGLSVADSLLIAEFIDWYRPSPDTRKQPLVSFWSDSIFLVKQPLLKKTALTAYAVWEYVEGALSKLRDWIKGLLGNLKDWCNGRFANMKTYVDGIGNSAWRVFSGTNITYNRGEDPEYGYVNIDTNLRAGVHMLNDSDRTTNLGDGTNRKRLEGTFPPVSNVSGHLVVIDRDVDHDDVHKLSVRQIFYPMTSASGLVSPYTRYGELDIGTARLWLDEYSGDNVRITIGSVPSGECVTYDMIEFVTDSNGNLVTANNINSVIRVDHLSTGHTATTEQGIKALPVYFKSLATGQTHPAVFLPLSQEVATSPINALYERFANLGEWSVLEEDESGIQRLEGYCLISSDIDSHLQIGTREDNLSYLIGRVVYLKVTKNEQNYTYEIISNSKIVGLVVLPLVNGILPGHPTHVLPAIQSDGTFVWPRLCTVGTDELIWSYGTVQPDGKRVFPGISEPLTICTAVTEGSGKYPKLSDDGRTYRLQQHETELQIKQVVRAEGMLQITNWSNWETMGGGLRREIMSADTTAINNVLYENFENWTLTLPDLAATPMGTKIGLEQWTGSGKVVYPDATDEDRFEQVTNPDPNGNPIVYVFECAHESKTGQKTWLLTIQRNDAVAIANEVATRAALEADYNLRLGRKVQYHTELISVVNDDDRTKTNNIKFYDLVIRATTDTEFNNVGRGTYALPTPSTSIPDGAKITYIVTNPLNTWNVAKFEVGNGSSISEEFQFRKKETLVFPFTYQANADSSQVGKWTLLAAR